MNSSPQAVNHQTHVCFISNQPIPNLLPLLQEKPGRALFIVTPQMAKQAARLERVVQRHGIAVTMKSLDSAYDYEAVQALCEDLLKAEKDDLILNVTGGTKIVALAAFETFFFFADSRRVIYCDTEHDRLLQLAPDKRQSALTSGLIKVNDYLACYGMPRIKGGKPPAGADGRRDGLAALADLLVHNKDLLSKLNSSLCVDGAPKNFANISLNVLGDRADKLAAMLEKCGVAERTSSTGLHIPSPESLFFCRGGWLEEFVYWTVKDLGLQGLDVAINVRVQWDERQGKETKNEFDILFTYRNRLHLISCKASNPDRVTKSGTRATEALNELDSLADRAGGLFGRAMLISSRPLSAFDRSRAAKMNICLVDGVEVMKLGSQLCAWLGCQ